VTLDEIEAFVAIAQLGGFTEASRTLNRSQPAISRRIRELERALGGPLFARAGRGVALTDAGRTLLPHAEAALAAVRDGERAVRDHLDDAERAGAGTLHVAIVGTLADVHLVAALRAFRDRYAGASVHLRTATSREVSALVRSGDAELGMRYLPDEDPALESVPLGAERLRVVVPAGHPVTARRLPDLRPLAGEQWLGFPKERRQPDSFGHLLERLLAAAGATDAQVTPVDSLTAQKRLVEAGLGIALMPTSSVREELRAGSLRAIEIASVRTELPVVVVRRWRGYRSRYETAFLQVLVDHTPDLRVG
jgi:DNA-binding transcriptional LysR family regulator